MSSSFTPRTGCVEDAAEEPGDLGVVEVVVLHRVEVVIPCNMLACLLSPEVCWAARVVQSLPELWVQQGWVPSLLSSILLPIQPIAARGGCGAAQRTSCHSMYTRSVRQRQHSCCSPAVHRLRHGARRHSHQLNSAQLSRVASRPHWLATTFVAQAMRVKSARARWQTKQTNWHPSLNHALPQVVPMQYSLRCVP